LILLESARSLKAAELAINGIEGNIQTTIQSIRKRLIEQLTEIEARIDFEEDLPILNEKHVKNELIEIKKDLIELIDNAKRGSWVRSGLKVALTGKPNVGKSSLLNRLCKQEKAIVTDLPGTTRDLLESEIVLEGIPVTFIDTAGLRETKNIIEKIGISRTKKTLIQADLIILIFDYSKGWTSQDESILKQLPINIPFLIVGNKSDLKNKQYLERIPKHVLEKENLVIMSAKTGKPNVGKSSLLNRLCKQEKAIVTDLPGTTRDLLESEIVLEGIPVTFIDTAGLRETENIIEKIGISRTKKTLIQADLIILIFDYSKGWTSQDESILKQLPINIPFLIVGNKSDLKNKQYLERIPKHVLEKENLVIMSAKTGKPNVGKSSLLNRLCKQEKAIVTDLPGTTRDLLESEVVLEGIPVTFIDTAGLRETENIIEKIGISRTKKTLIQADLIILIFDYSKGWTSQDESILKQLPINIPFLIVGNKSDLKNKQYLERIPKHVLEKENLVIMSAKTGKPNVGKSSLLNRLCKQEKAIVTELPGTTRDLLESEIVLEGIPVTFIDTAGLRETENIIEKIGISRTKKTLIQADLIILIFDYSKGWTSQDESILKQLPINIPFLIVGK
jgi:small GTP-binding protein